MNFLFNAKAQSRRGAKFLFLFFASLLLCVFALKAPAQVVTSAAGRQVMSITNGLTGQVLTSAGSSNSYWGAAGALNGMNGAVSLIITNVGGSTGLSEVLLTNGSYLVISNNWTTVATLALLASQGVATTNEALAIGAALTNALAAQGVVLTNYSVASLATLGSSLTNALAGQGTSMTNWTLGIGTSITNAFRADEVVMTNFIVAIVGLNATNATNYTSSQVAAVGLNATNAIAAEATARLAAGTAITNALAGQGAAITNDVGVVGTAVTNALTTQGTATTNYVQTQIAGLGTANTNSFTAQIAVLGQNDTNFAKAVGQSLTNVLTSQGTAVTNALANQGTAQTNNTLATGAAVTNALAALGSNATNNTAAAIALAGLQATNLTTTQIAALGLNDTNFTKACGTAVTNVLNTLATISSLGFQGAAISNLIVVVGTSVTNAIAAAGLNGTNYAGSLSTLIGLNATNLVTTQIALLGLASSNLTQSAGVAITNVLNSLATIASVALQGTSLTNALNGSGLNITNDILTLGTNATNAIIASTNTIASGSLRGQLPFGVFPAGAGGTYLYNGGTSYSWQPATGTGGGNSNFFVGGPGIAIAQATGSSGTTNTNSLNLIVTNTSNTFAQLILVTNGTQVIASNVINTNFATTNLTGTLPYSAFPSGSTGQVLSNTGAAVVWATSPTGGGSGGGGNSNFFAPGTNIVVASASGMTGTTNTVSVAAGVVTNNNTTPVTLTTLIATIQASFKALVVTNSIMQTTSHTNSFNAGAWFDDGMGDITAQSVNIGTGGTGFSGNGGLLTNVPIAGLSSNGLAAGQVYVLTNGGPGLGSGVMILPGGGGTAVTVTNTGQMTYGFIQNSTALLTAVTNGGVVIISNAASPNDSGVLWGLQNHLDINGYSLTHGYPMVMLGGYSNYFSALSLGAAMLGGVSNEMYCLQGGQGHQGSILAGGFDNTMYLPEAGANNYYDAILAGASNQILGPLSSGVIVGGANNIIYASSSTSAYGAGVGDLILGGYANAISNQPFTAVKSNAVAMGVRAVVTNNNTFVWSDGTTGAFFSTNDNTFNVFASGGINLYGPLNFATGGGGNSNYNAAGTNIVIVTNSGTSGTTNIISVGPGVLTNNEAGNVTFAGSVTAGFELFANQTLFTNFNALYAIISPGSGVGLTVNGDSGGVHNIAQLFSFSSSGEFLVDSQGNPTVTGGAYFKGNGAGLTNLSGGGPNGNFGTSNLYVTNVSLNLLTFANNWIMSPTGLTNFFNGLTSYLMGTNSSLTASNVTATNFIGSGAGLSNTPGFINVKFFGAVGNYPTSPVDDHNAIQNAINSVPQGGTIYLPAGTYSNSTALIVTNCITFLGDGKGADNDNVGETIMANVLIPAATTVVCSNAAITNLIFSNCPAGMVKNIRFANQATNCTAGYTILCVSTNNSQCIDIKDTTIIGGYNGVMENGGYYTLENDIIQYQYNNGLIEGNAYNDYNDSHVIACNFISRHHPGNIAISDTNCGGLNVIGCKINGNWTNGIYMNWGGIAQSSSNVKIDDCSIENTLGVAIQTFNQNGAATYPFNNLSIENCQIAMYGTANVAAIGLNSGVGNAFSIHNIIVSACTFQSAIALGNMTNGQIGGIVTSPKIPAIYDYGQTNNQVYYLAPTITTYNASSTVTFNTNQDNEQVNNFSGSTISSLTINLPAVSWPGQPLEYFTAGACTSVTVNATTLFGASLTSLSANSTVKWEAVDSVGTFKRTQ